jgi:hypothetical protein
LCFFVIAVYGGIRAPPALGYLGEKAIDWDRVNLFADSIHDNLQTWNRIEFFDDSDAEDAEDSEEAEDTEFAEDADDEAALFEPTMWDTVFGDGRRE